MGNFPSFFRHLFKKLAFQLVKDLSCPSSCNFLSSQGILDGNANIASLVPFSFWGPHYGNEQRWVAWSRKPDGGHLRPCSGGRIGAGRRASFRWVAFACLDLRRRNGNLGLPEACRLEIHSRLLPFFLVGTIVGWLVFDFFQEGDDRVRLLKYVVGGILLG